MLTKKQERETLKKIRDLIDAAGPDSYIARTFEGCCDLCEDNITNDFWVSYRSLAESHAADLSTAAQRIKDLEEANDYLMKRILSEEEARLLSAAARNWHRDSLERAKEAAAAIVEHAENPTGPDFTAAVARHRIAARAADKALEILEILERI